MIYQLKTRLFDLKKLKKAKKILSIISAKLLYKDDINKKSYIINKYVFEKRYAKIFDNNIHKLKKKVAYMITFQWQF